MMVLFNLFARCMSFLLPLLAVLLFTACERSRPEWDSSTTIGIYCGSLSSLLSTVPPVIAVELGKSAAQTPGRITIHKTAVSDIKSENSNSDATDFAVEFSVPAVGTSSCRRSGTGTIYVRSTVPVQNGSLRVASDQPVRIYVKTDQDSVLAEAVLDPKIEAPIFVSWSSQP